MFAGNTSRRLARVSCLSSPITQHCYTTGIRKYSIGYKQPSKEKDLRICFIGDSLVAGFGDTQHLGWPGRLCGSIQQTVGGDITCYNLGVRGATSTDIKSRWYTEVKPRLLPKWPHQGVLFFSLGVNDCVIRDGARRVDEQVTVDNMQMILSQAKGRWPVFVLGPLPSISSGDEALNDRIAQTNDDFDALCREENVPFLRLFEQLVADSRWAESTAFGDGIHPNGDGYQMVADAVSAWPEWRGWSEKYQRATS